MSGVRPGPMALLAIAFGAGGLIVEWLASRGSMGFSANLDLVAGWIVGGVGMAAWASAPRSRIGPLLVLSGVGWFAGTAVAPSTSLAKSDLGPLLGVLWQCHAGFLIHAVATWPSGRITRPTQLVLVVGGYVASLFPQVWAEQPAYFVLGALLAGGLLLDELALTPARRAAYRPARAAGLLLALVLAGGPAFAQAAWDLGWALLGYAGTLWAMAVTAAAVLLAASLVGLERRGASADVAVVLRESAEAGPDGELERLVAEATAADTIWDPTLRRAVAGASTMVERNALLRNALAGRVEELAASRRRLVVVGDEERRALGERLRSGAGARLLSLDVLVRSLSWEPWSDAGSPGARLRRAADQLARARAELDALSAGLDPGRLGERGLEAALLDLAATSPVSVVLVTTDGVPETPSIASTLYFVAAEALANVVRHAHAQAAWLQVRAEPGGWVLVVEDDGVGGADVGRGSGLRGLRERVEALGGGLIVGGRPGGGTQLRVDVPIATAVGSAEMRA